MDGYTASQVRQAEAPLLREGIPLMARAATGLATEIRARAKAPARILFLLESMMPYIELGQHQYQLDILDFYNHDTRLR